VETANFHDMDAERLEPGEKSLEGCLVPEGAMHNRFHRLHRGAQPLEIEQESGRKDPDDADFVRGLWQRGLQRIAVSKR
jgi:hypothetical protein